MTTLIICEKPSQAKNVKMALGSNSKYNVLAAQGHLYRLKEPHEVNPDWSIWSTEILSPSQGTYPLVESRIHGKGPRLDAFKNALKTAHEVIIATDCDREGQAIGTDIVLQMKYKGPVKRAMFQNEDAQTIREAIASAKPNSDYARLYDAAQARRQTDQIFNLSLTRIVSICLKPKDWQGNKSLGVGRVKTPTFGIVCERELAIRNFTPQQYFVLSALAQCGSHNVRLNHKTTNETRLLERQKAEMLAQTVRAWQGTIKSTTERKKQSPEKLMDLPTLQKRCAKWGWSASETLEVAQSLYADHKISSYPRAETRYLNEILQKDTQPILDALHGIYPVSKKWTIPIIRKGKSGVFSDEGIGSASHHAIIPNVNMLSELPEIYGKLNPKERQLFDLIAQTYLAAIAPDFVYDQTTLSIEVPFDQKKEIFSTTGRVPVELGWKEIYVKADQSEDEDNSDGEQDEEQGENLPPIPNSTPTSVKQCDIADKMTTPPSRMTEGDLIDAMQNCWRFVDDPVMRERLKEAKGIGRSATRDQIIASLIDQQWLAQERKGKTKVLYPTSEGLTVYGILKEHAHWLIDPAFTAEMEIRLDAILDGKINSDRVISAITTVATKIRDKIIEVAPPPPPSEASTEPSEAQQKLAERIATEKAVPLPENYKTDRVACSAFIQEHYSGKKEGKRDGKGKSTRSSAGASATPSEKQVSYAQTLATRKKIKLPASTLKDPKKLSAWIDKNK